MKTSRWFRIFMMAMDSLVLILIRPFTWFTKLFGFEKREDADMTPHAVESTRPERLGIKPELEVDGEPVGSYTRSEPICFEPDEPYSQLEGIFTFRGDHLRSGGAFGTAEMPERKLEKAWETDTGKLKKSYGKGYWTGSGWTGQPLIVRLTDEQKKAESLYEEKKDKPGLTEAVYSTMDGRAYFIDIEDGSITRDCIDAAMPFKGAGALDPRGLPLAFFGPGDAGPAEDAYARALIYSTADGSRLFEYGGQDPFALRKFHGYDSSPLVDAATDTLIEPGENGILYTMKLNTSYDKETGRVSIAPTERVKLRYSTSRSSEKSYWLGMEDSAAIWKNYLYIADNGGNLLCIDLNTMTVVWAQDTEDDTNGSPVLAVENGVPYIYIATSLHWKASKRLKLGRVPIFKINAITGEYVWIRRYLCNTVAGISGGVQATAALGRGAVKELVFFPVARTPHVRSGLLVALDRSTGREVWRYKMKRYAWSSPVLVGGEGRETIVLGDSVGRLLLIDAATGKELDCIELGSNIEATPAVFENTIVVGTRGQKIFGVRLK